MYVLLKGLRIKGKLTLRLLMSYIYMELLVKPEMLTSYTGCPRRNVKYFRRVFLMLNYTDITQNTYPKLNGYGVNGHRKVWPSVVSTNCTPSVTQYSSTAQARQADFFMQ